MLVVDECSTVPAIWTPILLYKGGDQVVFVGDDQQLPAVTAIERSGVCELAKWRQRKGKIYALNVGLLYFFIWLIETELFKLGTFL